jgi:hypothetical protein
VEAVAEHRQVTLRPLATVTDGYDVIAQNKWRAWRRKNQLDTDCHEDFTNQLAGVLEFVDPILTRLVPDESTWDRTQTAGHSVPLQPCAVDNVEGSALNGQIEAVFGIASPGDS